jgi:hypothetical protein
VFENRRLRRIFVHGRQGMIGNWRKLCNEVKGKAVPQHTMEAQGERRYSFYSFMTSALNGGEWLASHFTPRERTLGTHWTGGWVDPRWNLEKKSSFLC